MKNFGKAPFRYDIVGSFLRPQVLKEARENFVDNKITKEALTQTEDECIRTLVKKQKELGLKAITDGEFRRRWWHLDFISALNGLTTYDFVSENGFQGVTVKAQSAYVSDRISFPNEHPFLAHFSFLKKEVGEDAVPKFTIPGPNMIYASSLLVSTQYQENPVYTDFEAAKADIVQTYRDAIKAFYDAGCRYLQIDDTAWGALLDDKFRDRFTQFGHDPEVVLEQFTELTRESIAEKPDDLTLTFHMCRGNFKSTWLYQGAYDNIAKELLSLEKFDGFFLEYDDERSGDFQPLAQLKDQRVVLGLITSKTPELEEEDKIIARIQEAAQTAPLENLCLSPQCGFSSTQEGNSLTEEEQWEKIRLVKRIAERVWKDA